MASPKTRHKGGTVEPVLPSPAWSSRQQRGADRDGADEYRQGAEDHEPVRVNSIPLIIAMALALWVLLIGFAMIVAKVVPVALTAAR